jgi:hypothetical protein
VSFAAEGAVAVHLDAVPAAGALGDELARVADREHSRIIERCTSAERNSLAWAVSDRMAARLARMVRDRGWIFLLLNAANEVDSS